MTMMVYNLMLDTANFYINGAVLTKPLNARFTLRIPAYPSNLLRSDMSYVRMAVVPQ